MEGYRQRIYGQYLSGKGTASKAEVNRLFEARAAHLRSVVRRFLPKDRNARIVEVGAGYGAFVSLARAAGYSAVEGYDCAQDQVAASQDRGVEGINQADLLGILAAMPSESCDVIVAFDVIEHLKKDELLCCADSVYRVLRKGGRWLIHVPNAESPMFGRIRYGDLTHEIAFTSRSLRQLLTTIGFSGVECLEDAHFLIVQ